MMDHFYRSLVASGSFQPGSRTAPLEWALCGDCILPMLAHPQMAVDAVQVGSGGMDGWMDGWMDGFGSCWMGCGVVWLASGW